VHGDTNQGEDVYEYVDGRPQLITPGTGGTQGGGEGGLIGVSADGRDVYFSTVETLVPQDHNGLYLKFYDATAGGGFSAAPPPPPCEAADECHGAGSGPPPAPKEGTGVALGVGGNFTSGPRSGSRKHKKHKRKGKRHHGQAARGGGGNK